MEHNIYITNYWWAANYGAILTNFALNTVLYEKDYSAKNIDNSDYGQLLLESKKSFHTRFNQKHINSIVIKELKNLKENSTFIVGSDQVFRYSLTKPIYKSFLMDFVAPYSKKIAFAASFGVDKEQFLKETPEHIISEMKNSLNSFDFISVREKAGVEICRDIFGVNAEWIIDPVFILDKSKYEEMLSTTEADYTNRIVAHFVANADKKINSYQNQNVLNLHSTNISVEEWLSAIKNCKLLIADSYHAICFAIIFNKPFIAITKQKHASSRFDSLFEMLGIEYQCITSIDEIYERDCVFNVDWDVVNRRIEEERQRGLEFLKKALDAPCGKFEEKQAVRTKYLENKVCELESQANLKYQIKKELWNLWLVIWHKYLPNPIKCLIRKLRGK